MDSDRCSRLVPMRWSIGACFLHINGSGADCRKQGLGGYSRQVVECLGHPHFTNPKGVYMTAASKILATALLTVATGIAYAQSPSATDPSKPAPAPSNTENQRTPIDKGAGTPSAPSLPSAQSSMPEKSAATPAPQVE